MSYVSTVDIIAKLKERLESLPVSPSNSEKLFQRVGVFGANRLVEALQATFATESRVVFIVPGGDSHANSQPDALLVQSRRSTRIALLIADQVMNADTSEAVIGGSAAIGILPLKDAVAQSLSALPLDIPGVALVPGDGEPFVISNDDTKGSANTLGREAWLQWFSTYAGETLIAVP